MNNEALIVDTLQGIADVLSQLNYERHDPKTVAINLHKIENVLSKLAMNLRLEKTEVKPSPEQITLPNFQVDELWETRGGERVTILDIEQSSKTFLIKGLKYGVTVYFTSQGNSYIGGQSANDLVRLIEPADPFVGEDPTNPDGSCKHDYLCAYCSKAHPGVISKVGVSNIQEKLIENSRYSTLQWWDKASSGTKEAMLEAINSLINPQ